MEAQISWDKNTPQKKCFWGKPSQQKGTEILPAEIFPAKVAGKWGDKWPEKGGRRQKEEEESTNKKWKIKKLVFVFFGFVKFYRDQNAEALPPTFPYITQTFSFLFSPFTLSQFSVSLSPPFFPLKCRKL